MQVLEEAPAPGLPASFHSHIGEAAVRAAQAVGYVNAGERAHAWPYCSQAGREGGVGQTQRVCRAGAWLALPAALNAQVSLRQQPD